MVEISKRKAAGAILAVAMVAAIGGGGTALAVQSFTDVPPSHPFASEIEWAAANGIVNGYPDGTFQPSANVTRQAATAFQSRYNDSVELSTTTTQFVAGTSPITPLAYCPVGKRALSGGGYTSSGKLVEAGSYPVAAGGNQVPVDLNDAVGWRIFWRMYDGGTTLDTTTNFTVWVLCAPKVAS